MWSELRYRLRALFRRRAMERELADELQFHVDRQAESHNVESRADFGGIEQIKEECRDERGIGTFDRASQDLRYALRMFVRQPAFATAVIATLALGIGGATTMFAVVDGVLLKPLPYGDADRIIRLGRTFGGVRVTATSAVDYRDIATRSRALSHVAVARTETVDVVTGAAAPERLEAAAVSASYFDVLGIAPALGQTLAATDDKPGSRAVAVISHSLWQRRFASHSNPVGQSVLINGEPHTVVAVMPRRFLGPEALGQRDVDLWLPLGRVRLSTDADEASLGTIAKLESHANADTASAELTAIGVDRKFWTAPLQAETIGNSASGLWLLFGGVSLLLLLACTNIAHLFLVRATERGREMAVRAAMGAGSGRIARQLVTETLCFSLAGGLAGALVAYAGVEVVRLWAPAELPRISDLQVDLRVLLFAFGIAAIAGTAFGAGPALRVRRADFAGLLRGTAAGLTAGRSHQRIRTVLVTLQTAMAVMLVAGAGVLANTVWQLSHVNPGFDASNVVWLDVTLPERAYSGGPPKIAFFSDVLNRARASSELQAVSVIQGRPLGGGNSVATVSPEGHLPADGQQPPRVPYHVVAPGYFSAMRIPQLQGRDFTDQDRLEAPRVAIVSRAFADRFWPGESAIGQRFWMGRVAADAPLTEVIGVVEEVRQYALADAPIPMVYRAFAQVPRGAATLVARHDGRSSTAALDRLRSSVQTLDSALSLDRAGTMDAQVSSSIREPRFRAIVLSAFGLIACVIACVGLYGSLAFLVRARSHELGVRLALGAHGGQLRGSVIRHGLLLSAAGITLGLAAAAVGAQSIASLTFGVASLDVATCLFASAAMLLVALIACWIPAQRAARISPMEILRD